METKTTRTEPEVAVVEVLDSGICAYDTRDSSTMWLWPKGYGVGSPIELSREQIEEMYKCLWAVDTAEQDPDDVEIKVTLKK